ncbi:flagellin [Alteromonas sp. KUL42]|uniref:flagellin N-terminal helical domain-containing protein n=1 Tax=Alteromonas sp. KUL42 TaxID=2480797 RepID=UPI00103601AB|nr:flagellin [Alteromonas sp. KUL42]TAP38472.1 flagellin [Alteromonas sp. KUL42]GEA05730.1 flagellin [Alteromonas sp. KUL42]
MLNVSSFTQSLTSTPLLSKSLSAAYERLSSGLRINKAADDSAGLQISNRMSSEAMAYNQLQRNLNNGISYAQVAEGGLQESATILQRMRQLAIQSQNGINNKIDRAALDKEFQALKLELNAIAYGTEVFNRLPLVGDANLLSDNVPSLGDTFTQGVTQNLGSGLRSIAYIPAGSSNVQVTINDNGANDDIQVFTTSGKHLAGTPITNATWSSSPNNISSVSDLENRFFLTSNGYNGDARYDDSELLTSGSATIDGTAISFSGDQNPGNLNEVLTIASNAQPLIISVIGNGRFDVTATWSSLGDENDRAFTLGPADITATNKLHEGTQYIEVGKTPATLEDLSLENTSISSEQGAQDALSQIDQALETVSASRAFYGAKIHQMTSALNVNAIANENISQARSQITDTDFAKETARSTQSQIVEQASIAVRAQAQSSDGQVLELLNRTVEQ